jgi:hypothetical protein
MRAQKKVVLSLNKTIQNCSCLWKEICFFLAHSALSPGAQKRAELSEFSLEEEGRLGVKRNHVRGCWGPAYQLSTFSYAAFCWSSPFGSDHLMVIQASQPTSFIWSNDLSKKAGQLFHCRILVYPPLFASPVCC